MTDTSTQHGILTISIDYEYAWGYVDRALTSADRERIRGETVITRRLLELFEQHTIPATWAIVGHLLEERHKGDTDTAWFDTEGLIPRIATSSVHHEIGSHSYAHVIYDNPAMPSADIEKDITHARRVHDEHSFPFRSFVFPRNSEGYHDILKRHGIVCVRGTTAVWYDVLPRALRALGRGIDYWLPTVSTSVPYRHSSGLVVIPESLLLVSRKGVQKLLPVSQACRKIIWCLNKAVERSEVFHLWFHPSNFSYDTEKQLALFGRILAYARALCDEGVLDILTMDEVSRRFEKS